MKILRPLRERDFALLWSGLVVSLIGDGIYLVAIAWQVYELSNMPSALALVGLAWSVGMALFLLTGGVISDHFERRRVMIAADLVRSAVLALIGVLAVTGQLQLWHLIACVVVYAAGEAFFGPAMAAIVPDILPREQLVGANALQQFVRQTCRLLIGPAIGGIIVALIGPGDAFLIDSGTFIVSAVMIALIRTRSFGDREHRTTLTAELREGLAFVRSHRWIWATLISSSVAMLMFYGPMQVLLPYIVKNDLGGGAGAFGLILAADGLGSVFASLTMSQRGRLPTHYLTVMYVAWTAATLPIACYALSIAEWQLMVLSGLHGALITIGLIIWDTLLQTRVPPEMRGRAQSVAWFTAIGLTPMSFALTGPVSAALGVKTTLILAGVIPAITTIGVFFAFRLRGEEVPIEDDQDLVAAPAGHADELERLPEALSR